MTGGLDLGTRISQHESASELDVSVSAKLVGPSFSKDSGDTDAIIMRTFSDGRAWGVHSYSDFNAPYGL